MIYSKVILFTVICKKHAQCGTDGLFSACAAVRFNYCKELMALNHAVKSHAVRSANYSSHALNKH